MIATIRVRADGSSSELCQLDLMKFSIEGVRQRMEEKGIREREKGRKWKAEKMRGLGVEEGKKGETRREGMSMRGGRTREIEQCEKSEDLDQRERKERE